MLVAILELGNGGPEGQNPGPSSAQTRPFAPLYLFYFLQSEAHSCAASPQGAPPRVNENKHLARIFDAPQPTTKSIKAEVPENTHPNRAARGCRRAARR